MTEQDDKVTDAADKEDIFITDLTIKKVRHLENIHIPLSEEKRKHLILTGKNGSGKTSVLESLKTHCISSGAQSVEAEFNQPLKDEEGGYYSFPDDFVLAFYAARRLGAMTVPLGVQKLNLKKKYSMDEYLVEYFLQHLVNLKVEKSFARDDNDLETVSKIDRWFDWFELSLRDIFDASSLRLEFDRKNFSFNIHQDGREMFDFNTLPDGYASIMFVVTDLLMRIKAPIRKSYDIQGVVLIDELEAHLHLDMQKKIFPFLTRFFPRIQFIVTTHSPFVLNSIENGVIYDLENHKSIDESLVGYPYDGIVEGYFETDKYSAAIKEKIETYETLVNQSKRSEAEEDRMMELRRYLRTIPGDLAPELAARFQQIELKRKGQRND